MSQGFHTDHPAGPTPSDVELVLARIRRVLAGVPGVTGLALGGSRARGTADAHSDIDVGIYYRRADRPEMDRIASAFAELDDDSRFDGHAGYGEWGPWINGGGWLHVNGIKTDVLLRDVDQVEEVVRACAAGHPQIHYQAGHPHGFCTAIYAGEIRHHRAFHDPDGTLARLRALTDPYPPPLAAKLIHQFGWESGFALDIAVTAARRGDLTYVSGCLYRSVACLTQVLFAHAGRFLVNEKGAVAEAATFVSTPTGFRTAVEHALSVPSPRPADLLTAVTELRAVRDEVLAATGDADAAATWRRPPSRPGGPQPRG